MVIMSILHYISYLLTGKLRAFVIDDSKEFNKTLTSTKVTNNLMIDGFTNCETLLYTLHSHKHNDYKVGIIHEDGSKYKPQILCKFIKEIDPDIKLVVYKNQYELQRTLLTYSI